MTWEQCWKAMKEGNLYTSLSLEYSMSDLAVLNELREFDHFYYAGFPEKLPQKARDVLKNWLAVKNSKLHMVLK